MHLFSRVGMVQGGPIETFEWATNITAKVNEVMDLEVTLWQGQFGYPLGTVAWSAAVESRAHLAEQTAKVAADAGYLDLVGQGQAFAGTTPYQDSLRTIVHMTAEPGDPPPVGAWAELTAATPAEGQIGAATAWGVEIADRYAAVTGTGAVFLADDYGPFGQVTWIAAHQDAAAADRASEALAGDADYLAAVDAAGGLFQPGTATRGALIRIA